VSLASGTSVGPYRIVSPIGAGGMGEVYRARDTRLGRDVALKILPDALANDPERLARFEREAKTLAALNHPHIAQIYGFEDRALAMELVDGEDLSQRIARGPLPVDEALAIARQIAGALEAAHDQGIIHRDLKPANIKVRADGTVKVLDFGLAKLSPAQGVTAAGPGNVLNSPTITSPAAMTMGGMILGTAAYMSPEQARGKPVDKRADIWAFGVVLYEMLAGARLFQGSEVSDVLAAVLRQELDWNALPVDTPASVVRVLRRSLERDPRRRLRDIGDAVADLSEPSGPTPPVIDRARHRPAGRGAAMLAAAVAAAAVAAAAAWMLKPAPAVPDAPIVRVSYPMGAPLTLTNQRPQLAISPDGRYIATIVGCCVNLRRVDQLTSTVVEGSERAVGVFFSPDSQWVGFWTSTAIKKSSVTGGGTSTISEPGISVAGGPVGITWADNGLLYYGTLTGISSVPVNGGQPQLVLAGPGYAHPHALPGSRGLLLTRGVTPATGEAGAEAILYRFDGGEPIALTNGSSPRLTSTRHLLVARGSDILAAPLDLANGRLTREAVAVAQQVAMLGSSSQFDVSRTGTLVYIPGAAGNNPRVKLARVTLAGATQTLSHPNREYSDPRISPDGRRIALHLMDQQNDVWVAGTSGGALTRMSFRPLEEETPAWSPDGAWLAFAGWGDPSTTRQIWRRRVDGRGDEELLWSGTEHVHVTDWTADGKQLVVEVQNSKTRGDLHVLELGPPHRSRVFLQTPFDETSGRVSPDSHWIAYRSNESGQSEIFVQPFPHGGGRVQVSTDGGIHPVWSRDGRYLYYRSPTEVMSVRVVPGATFAADAPVSLFKDVYARPQGDSHTTFDVLPGGDFIFLEYVQVGDLSSLNPVMIAVFNWFGDLRARVEATNR
jgi:hypothetical protein